LPVGGKNIRAMRSGLLSNSLFKSGHDVELWLPGFEHVHHFHYQKESVQEVVNEKYTIQYIKGCGYNSDTNPKRFIHNKQIAQEFYRLAKSRSVHPDLIITQIPSLELAEAVTSFAEEFKIPVIVDIRDLWPDVYKRFFPAWCKFLYGAFLQSEIRRVRRILKSATAITAVSKKFLYWGIDHAKRNASRYDRVFHIGYPDENFTRLSEDKLEYIGNKYRINTKKIFILFAGTFCDSYDLNTVFKSAEILLKKHFTNIEFIIAGSGKKDKQIQKICKNLDNVSFVGWLDANDMKLFLELSSIGLAPYSRNALMSLPNKPFEYMAASLPILNSLKGELSQLIEEKNVGINYKAGDASSLADAIMSLCNNPQEILRMGDRGKQFFDNNFNSENIYLDFANYLEEINDEFGRKKIKRN
jgi:glycosyltransferase involved in cell wall biosynthesis